MYVGEVLLSVVDVVVPKHSESSNLDNGSLILN